MIEYEQKSAQELLYQVRNDTQDETYRKSQEMEEKYVLPNFKKKFVSIIVLF